MIKKRDVDKTPERRAVLAVVEDLSLEDLERKLRKHLRNWKMRQEKLDDAAPTMRGAARQSPGGSGAARRDISARGAVQRPARGVKK